MLREGEPAECISTVKVRSVRERGIWVILDVDHTQ